MRETTVENGKVRGIPCGWPSITAFYGIPYAAPPVGELRWRAPQPAADWNGVRDCARASAKCPQLGVGKGSFFEKEFYPYEEEMSEDCLYLNVWTPAQEKEEKLPVIFWVHGGAFMTGYGHSAHFDGEHFARKGVILVTINYRLNIFGWMVHPELSAESEHGVSGNYGLLDQIFALQWVKRNIASFGGDPENITIAGQSAGAMCVQALLSSPLTEGLAAKAIMQSGGGITPCADMRFPTLAEAEARTDLSLLGVSSIEEARALSWQEVLERWMKSMPGHGLTRTPVQDGYVLPLSLDEAARTGNYRKIPCLMGYKEKEGIAVAPGYDAFVRQMEEEYGSEKAKEYLALCPEPEHFSEFIQENFREEVQAAALAWAETLEEQKNGPVYLYCLDRKLPGDEKGAFHAADLWYVFQTFMRGWRPWTGEDYELAHACNSYWAGFARTGKPCGPDLPEWTPYTKENPLTMELGERIGMLEIPENDRITFRKEFLRTGK